MVMHIKAGMIRNQCNGLTCCKLPDTCCYHEITLCALQTPPPPPLNEGLTSIPWHQTLVYACSFNEFNLTIVYNLLQLYCSVILTIFLWCQFIVADCPYIHLTHVSLASFLWDKGKQNSPRYDAAKLGIPSGAILFAERNFFEK